MRLLIKKCTYLLQLIIYDLDEKSYFHFEKPNGWGMKKSKGSKKKSKKNSTNSREDNDDHIKYLEAWKSDKSNWKFEKVKQMRLLSGMFDAKKIPENVFPLFVEYMKNSTGNARKTAVEKATEIIDEMEKWTSLTEEDQEKATKPDIEKYERARTLIQTLE